MVPFAAPNQFMAGSATANENTTPEKKSLPSEDAAAPWRATEEKNSLQTLFASRKCQTRPKVVGKPGTGKVMNLPPPLPLQPHEKQKVETKKESLEATNALPM
jgi:Cdc6-like AAA superfamily ATPase